MSRGNVLCPEQRASVVFKMAAGVLKKYMGSTCHQMELSGKTGGVIVKDMDVEGQEGELSPLGLAL